MSNLELHLRNDKSSSLRELVAFLIVLLALVLALGGI